MEVVATANSMTWASVAMFFVLFKVCNSCIALIPNGVAALPIPRILAAKYSAMAEFAGWSFGTPGNRSRITGEMALPSFSQRPALSMTFISPQKNAIMPIRPIAILTASPANLKRLSNSPCIFPVTPPATTAMTTSATQI